MATCPKCRETIDYVRQFTQGEQETEIHYHQKAEEVYHEIITFHPREDDHADDFECPVCSEVLFYDLEEAEKFIRSPPNKRKKGQKGKVR